MLGVGEGIARSSRRRPRKRGQEERWRTSVKRSARRKGRDLADERLTEEVLARFENSSSLLRFKEITQGFVRHLHAFVSEVES